MSRIVTLALCLSVISTPVLAESFLERLARQTAEKAAQKAADKVMNGGDSASKNKKSDAPEPEDDPQEGQVLKPKPRAGNAPTSQAAKPPAPTPTAPPAPKAKTYPGAITISDDIKAKKAAFDAFGEVSCDDCEGGRSYDSWAKRFFGGELGGEYNGWAKKLGKMNVGDRLTWKGTASKGMLTVVSENPVEGFRCKQLVYRLDKPKSSAERPGLLCWGKLNEYSASDTWVEVY